jgi:hypothetical protein
MGTIVISIIVDNQDRRRCQVRGRIHNDELTITFPCGNPIFSKTTGKRYLTGRY